MNRFFNEALWIDFLSITLVILVAIILYRLLLRFLSRKHVKTEMYCTLYDVEDQPVSGEVPFYFATQTVRNVEILLESEQGKVIATLANESFSEGGHLLRYDCSFLDSGNYYYVLKTENQEIRKKLVIRH